MVQDWPIPVLLLHPVSVWAENWATPCNYPSHGVALTHAFFECMAGQSSDDALLNLANWWQHQFKAGHPLPGDVADTDVEWLLDAVDN